MDSLAILVVMALGCFLLLLACFGWRQPRIAHAIQNWGQPIQGLEEPADLFYARVYQRLQDHLTATALPDAKVGFGPGHLFGNRTIFGPRPQYLVVRYSHLTIYLYCFPLPGGLYVSYWAFSKYTLWLEHPILKWLVFWKSWQMTIYQCDITDMCLSTINRALQEVLDDYCVERGLKPLEDYERRPILQSFYAKYKQGNPPMGAYGNGYVMPLPSGGPAAFVPAAPPAKSQTAPANAPTA